jgi:hypothetical protein
MINANVVNKAQEDDVKKKQYVSMHARIDTP